MIDGLNSFDQPIKNYQVTYDNIRKIENGQGDDCTIGCLLYYPYIKEHYKMIAIDLSKQQALDAVPKKNTEDQFYWKSRLGRRFNIVFHY